MLNGRQDSAETMSQGDAVKVHVLAAYGPDNFYHYGAIFAALRIFSAFRKSMVRPDIWVYTDRPELFSGYPVFPIHLTPEKIAEWSLGGRYHFRIKNRVLVDALSRRCSSLLFLDSDMVVKDSTDKDFRAIARGSAVLYLEEGKACRINPAYLGLRELSLNIGSEFLALSGEEPMWRSSVIGVSSAMTEALNQADELICQLVGKIEAHTIEQFALGVALSRVTGLNASKTRFIDYSDHYNKAIARERLSAFFRSFGNADFEAQVAAAARVRPTSVIQRFKLKRGLATKLPNDYIFVPR